MKKRKFLFTLIPLALSGIEKITAQENNLTHFPINWQELEKELYFSKIDVYENNSKVDTIATVKINPQYNKIKVFNSYISPKNYKLFTIEEWQKRTNAPVIVNSAQYMADPYAMPCALNICNGNFKGPKFNKKVRGMLIAEPKDKSKPLADILDFEYDEFDYKTTTYTQGVQHWPILLDRNKKIKVNKSNWKANRTVVAKDYDNNILFLTTEGGYFTLYNFGKFLKNSNLNIHTAMNLDGGYEACMNIKTKNFDYITYGQFETQGPNKNISIPGIKIRLPGTIGVSPR